MKMECGRDRALSRGRGTAHGEREMNTSDVIRGASVTSRYKAV